MPDLTLTSQLAHAQDRLDSGDYADVITVCRQILTVLPRCIQPYALLAQAMLQLGAPERAEDLYARVLSVDPQNLQSTLGVAVIQQGRGAHREAQAWVRRAAELAVEEDPYPSDWLTQAVARIGYDAEEGLSRPGLAYFMLHSGMFRHAALEFRSAQAECPARADLTVGLAESAFRSGDLGSASEACDGLLLRLPDCLKALLIRGKLGLGGEMDEACREMLRRAQALDPENRLAQRLFGGDSPLPLRSARVPTAASEEPLALSYLTDMDDPDDSDEEGPLLNLQSIL